MHCDNESWGSSISMCDVWVFIPDRARVDFALIAPKLVSLSAFHLIIETAVRLVRICRRHLGIDVLSSTGAITTKSQYEEPDRLCHPLWASSFSLISSTRHTRDVTVQAA